MFKEKNGFYSMGSNLWFILKKSWQIDKVLLLSVVIKIPSLVILPLVTTYLSKIVVDLVEQNAELAMVLLCIGGIIAGIFLLRLIDSCAGAKIEWRSFSNRFAYIHLTSQKAMDTDYANIESPQGQLMQQKALNAVYSAQSGIQQVFNQLTSITSSFAGLITYSVLLFTLNPWILLYLVILSLVSYVMQRFNNAWIHRNKDNWVPLDRKLQYIINKSGDYTIGKDVKIYRMQTWFHDLFNLFFKQRKKWYRRQENKNFLFGFLNIALTFFRDGAAYLFLINRIVNGGMSAGDFVLYFGVISQYSGWLFGVMSALASLHATSLSLCDLRGFLDMPDHFNRGEGHILPSETCDIAFRHVAFSYCGDENLVLKDIDLRIRKGEKIAIVGLNGAGKTTLVKLLCGLYHPTSGSIEVDSVPVEAYNRDAYFTLFSVVFQDIILLPVSIAKNIALCEEAQIDRDKLNNALQLSGLYEKVEKLPNKENTMLMKSLVEDSIELSGGEEQKLALARALYKDGQIVVLDEPTAALDPLAEAQMYQTYNKLAAGRTSIFISHRLSSTRFCDRILYMENGCIVEEGTHDELMRCGGKYANLFQVQSQYYKEGEACSH